VAFLTGSEHLDERGVCKPGVTPGGFRVRVPEKLLQQPLGHTAPDCIGREAVLGALVERNVRESNGFKRLVPDPLKSLVGVTTASARVGEQSCASQATHTIHMPFDPCRYVIGNGKSLRLTGLGASAWRTPAAAWHGFEGAQGGERTTPAIRCTVSQVRSGSWLNLGSSAPQRPGLNY